MLPTAGHGSAEKRGGTCDRGPGALSAESVAKLNADLDAPRFWKDGSPRYGQIWLLFRSTMLANYIRDFAAWMTPGETPGGETLEPERWYSRQIPADYLNAHHPSSQYPNPGCLPASCQAVK